MAEYIQIDSSCSHGNSGRMSFNPLGSNVQLCVTPSIVQPLRSSRSMSLLSPGSINMKRWTSERKPKKPMVHFTAHDMDRDEYYIRRETIEYKELVYTKINRKIFYCKLTTCKEERAGILGITRRSRAIQHFLRVHGLQVDIPDQRLVKKNSAIEDQGDIDSAKRALRSYNPTISLCSKLAHVFIAGYMKCKKGNGGKGPGIDCTSPTSQVLESVLGKEDKVLKGIVHGEVLATEDMCDVQAGNIEAIKGNNQDKLDQAVGSSKSHRRRHKATNKIDIPPRRSARLNPGLI